MESATNSIHFFRRAGRRSIAFDAGWCPRFFRPQLEIMEDRIYPGDTILGLCAAALWGQSRASWDARFDAHYAERAGAWRLGAGPASDTADSLSVISLLEPFQDERGQAASRKDDAA